MKSNFAFLEKQWPLLASVGSTAEKYIYTDSNSCLIKLGLFAEYIVKLMFTLDSIDEPSIEKLTDETIEIIALDIFTIESVEELKEYIK